MSDESWKKELFDSRNNHEVRISLVENHIVEIKNDQREIKKDIVDTHKKFTGMVGEIRETIQDFITDINGIPKQNSQAIVDLTEDVDANTENILTLKEHGAEQRGFMRGLDKSSLFWLSVISVGFAVIGFFLRYFLDKS